MPTRAFVASNMPTAYPFKLQKPKTVDWTTRATADVFILDSGIGNDDMTNGDVLDLAHEYEADYVIAKDYLHDREGTTESILEFIDQYAAHPCESTPMLPLQPDHATHYRELCDAYGGALPFDHFVLGGMAVKTVSDADAVTYIKDFRRVAPDVYAHALGIGGGRGILSRLHGTGLIDSFDCATPEMAAANGCVMDSELRQKTVRIMNGEGARKRNMPLAEFNSWQLHDAWNGGREIEDQLTVADF